MPTAGEVARLSVVVEADTSPATKELDSFGTKVGGIGSTMATAFGGAAIAGIAAVGAGFASAVASAAGFESTMSAVKAVSGATAEQMDSLSGLALQLGKDTSFSASEAGKGIEELVKGGLSIPDIMNGAAKATLDLAAAGGVSLPDAATIAANALAEFNLKGEDMAHVADLIAGAANASALDVGQFKFSLQSAGAVAATIGFSFDDLAVAIAEMGKAGITGSDAGTSLKTMMLQLSPSTKSARTEMAALGIITAEGANQFFDASGKVKSMAEVAQVLQTATANLTQEQKINALQTIFGTDAIRAAAVLAKEGASGFDEMAASMGKVTAEAVGATKLDNLSGSFEQMKGSVETLAITFGLALLPVLRDTVDGTTKVINALIPLAQQWGPSVANAIKLMASELREALGGFVDWFTENWPLIEQTFKTVSGNVQTENQSLAGNFATTWGEIKGTVGTSMGNIGDTLKLAMHVINGDWEGAWKDLTAISERENKNRERQAELHGAAMQKVIDNWTGGALTKFDTWTKDVTGLTVTAWQGILDVTTTMWAGAQGIAVAIASAWTTIQTDTDTAGKALNNVITGIWDLIYTQVIQPKMDAITGAVGTAWGAISTKTHEVFDPILSYIRDTIFEPIRAAIDASINAAQTLFATAIDAISSKAHAVLDPILSYWRDTIWEPMRAAVDAAIYGPKGAHTQFESGVGSIKGVVDGVLQGVRSAWENTWQAIQRAAESPQQAMNEIITLVGKLKDIMPDWLIPHSPTPFQIGLEGIMKAARDMDRSFGDMTNVNGWLMAAMKHTGVPSNWLEPLKWLVAHESGGDPRAKNPNSTASGLFQIIDTTWAESRDPKLPNDIWNPVINAIAGIRYIIGRYGDPFNAVEFWRRNNHYAAGGWAGLNGPEWALLGEKGPEYVVPNHALRSTGGSGSLQTIRVDLAIGGKVAANIYVEGRDVAIRQGRAT